jgi:hypothetical protein
MSEFTDALKLKYKADIAMIQANLKNYLDNSVGVADHPDIVKDIDDLVSSLSTAQEKLKTIEDLKL